MIYFVTLGENQHKKIFIFLKKFERTGGRWIISLYFYLVLFMRVLSLFCFTLLGSIIKSSIIFLFGSYFVKIKYGRFFTLF